MHPDKHPGDKNKHEEFLILNKAYNALLNEAQAPQAPTNSGPHYSNGPFNKKKDNPRFTSNFWKRFYVLLFGFPLLYSFVTFYVEKLTYRRAAQRQLNAMRPTEQ